MGSKKACVLEETPSHFRVTLDVSESPAHTAPQSREILRGRVGERRGVQVRPEWFDGIEFGGIGREPFHAQPATVPLQRRAGEAAAVCREAIPHEQDPTPPMPSECV